MGYLTKDQLHKMDFSKLGDNVLISDKAALYNTELFELGDNFRVDDFCSLSGKITIGRNVHIATYCLMAGGIPGIFMEDFSGLAYAVKVFSQSDDYSGATLTNPTVPEEYKRIRRRKVVIGRHVIIGTASIVFPGVHIADGCSIGANALVNKSTEPWGIYSGNPAVRIKERMKGLLALEEMYLKSSSEQQ